MTVNIGETVLDLGAGAGFDAFLAAAKVGKRGRVLKPRGRLMVSDLVLTKELPESIRNSVEAYVGCLAGAAMKKDYLKYIAKAGFKDIKIVDETFYPMEAMANDPTAQAIMANSRISKEDIKNLENAASSIKVLALKPSRKEKVSCPV